MISSEQIEKRIIDYLYWDPRVDASDVDVNVLNGEVKIEGLVPDDTAIQKVEQQISSMPGVDSLDSDLAVEPSSDRPILTDEEIQETVECFLWATPILDQSRIGISVKDRIVTLKGTVEVYWKKLFAEKFADIRDVKGVINLLSVVPTDNILDQEIAQDVTAAINRIAGGGTGAVNVKVDRGEVSLSGPVPNWQVHRAVRKAAVSIPGVIDLESDKLEIAELSSPEYRMALADTTEKKGGIASR
jgi:osmotically-inducible protein OsmY